ncbi:MAG TPA: STAS domain-containing protein [Vicinamibacteria bacterium]|nr:STAS domain-containing protein [Vicinamibacteria bacterium]
MQIREETHDGVLVVAPIGRLDSNSSDDLEKALRSRLDGRPRLVIDLGGVDYVSSAGLRVLLIAAKRMHETGGQLVLCGLASSVHQIFEFAGFLRVFTIEASRPEALARLAPAS